MTSIPKTVAGTRTPFLERIEGGGAEVTIDERLVAITDPQGAAAEQYRMLLHRLRYARSLRGAAQGGAVIAVTSAMREEGTSLTAANLALTAARAGDSRVALIDCDLRRRRCSAWAPAWGCRTSCRASARSARRWGGSMRGKWP